MKHARISMSGLKRITACPGSVPLSEGLPNKSSPYAEEGTKAHTLAEMWLRGETNIPAEYLGSAWSENLKHVAVYTKHVRDVQVQDQDSILHIEQQVAVSTEIWGTADAVVWLPKFKELHIIDLKFGAGVAVDADTPQLKGYALATMLTFDEYTPEKIVATIVQPRCHHPDGPIRSVEYTPLDLLEFYAELQELEARVEAATKAFKEGN